MTRRRSAARWFLGFMVRFLSCLGAVYLAEHYGLPEWVEALLMVAALFVATFDQALAAQPRRPS